MKGLSTYINEAKVERMSTEELATIYDGLEKNDEITVKYESSFRGMTEGTFIVKKGKTKVGKAKVERITLVNKSNPKGVKYYFYSRNGRVSFAMGDMAASLVSIEK
tara:strand:+ start:592 stop:909 length:318 start_codon:yes stop_codon:yes gene_type:complete